MKASDVSAVLVTRGDVSLNPIMQSLPFDNVVVWDNSAPPRPGDQGVYGRYLALRSDNWDGNYTLGDTVFVQDDDCVLAPESFVALLDAYEPGKLVCNMPQRFRDTGFYDDHSLVGFGAVFDRWLPKLAFQRFFRFCEEARDTGSADVDLERLYGERVFHRTCDIVFTALTPRILVDAPYTDLPWASVPNRMWKQPEHVGERTRMLELVRKVRDGAAA